MKRSLPVEGYHKSLGNSRHLPCLVRGAIALSVALSVLNCTVMAAPPARKAPNPSIGMVTVTGNVTINGGAAISGQSLFSASTIVTSTDSESLIEFISAARLRLEAQTNLTVDSSSERISGILNDGRLVGFLPAGVLLDFKTADSSITTSTAEPVVFSIQSGVCSGTTLSVQTGSVDIQAAGKLRTVKAGETFSTSPNPSVPQSSGNNLSHRKRVGAVIAIGATIGIILGVALGRNGKDQTPFGGCVIVPSGDGGPNQCS
jgi:ferric-dicitrate binding protein FerR (iron transport regulator)